MWAFFFLDPAAMCEYQGAFQLITMCKVRSQSEPKCEYLLGNAKGRIPGQAVITINIPQQGYKTHKFKEANWDHTEMSVYSPVLYIWKKKKDSDTIAAHIRCR